MSPALSVKTLRDLLALLADAEFYFPVRSTHIRTEVERALASMERRASLKSKRKKAKREKRAEKSAATSEVWNAVAKRARCRCECGCNLGFEASPWGSATLDHFFGRARAESVESCWMLRAECHRQKTDNEPTAAYWHLAFIFHCEKYGYTAEAEQARRRLEGILSLREAHP